MRLACLSHVGELRLGVVVEDCVILLPDTWTDVTHVIEGGRKTLGEIERLAASAAHGHVPLASAQLLPPISRLRRDILCTGWNYWDHFEESKGKREGQDVERPKAPTFFTKGPDVVIGPRDPISFDPRISSKWDYEAEIALVIGKTGRSISQADAMDHIFAFCLANDISQRDLQRRHGGQWLKGKSIDRTMPLGPWLVTADEVDIGNLRLTCHLNGELMQDASTAQMAFPVAELIAELSFGMTLRPGDLLLTGTPAGIGNARVPPVFLKEGDEVVVRAPGLGELRNSVVGSDLYGNSSVPHAELHP